MPALRQCIKPAARDAVIALSVLVAAFSLPAQAKSKYGPEATLLRDSHQYVKSQTASDFWALIPYYTAQQTGSACSVASVTMTVNAARKPQDLTSDDELATQNQVLKKTGDEAWTDAVGPRGGGRTLDQLGALTEKAFKAYGFKDAKAEVIHADDTSKVTQAKIHAALVANEKNAGDFIIANFNQATYTGDAESGHIAPVGAYDAKNKRVLILDPDREWYEPYWVSEQVFINGLATQDKASGKSRGIVWVHTTK